MTLTSRVAGKRVWELHNHGALLLTLTPTPHLSEGRRIDGSPTVG